MHKILIVDDQYGIRALLKEVLGKEGYEIFEASTGMEALDMLENIAPDIMLLDIKIPGMDGIEILKEWKKRKIACQTRVILMTAYGELDTIKEAKQYVPSSYLTKPFDIDLVREKVEKELSLK
ncbi:response regulator [Alteribacillus iranensis]|uniref:Two-component system, response regulator, stage 0 sporulation protein F n=1 Tax=Alteribacillus iranensis TaxID=930128 RepID=A0A1I2C0M7_9BACI|nr:response regulator [Alteribacillus iranensis]SFE61931.1 two-component system, response regulator, stage 0 sporulation protein F [Alteribacillus iranensis]